MFEEEMRIYAFWEKVKEFVLNFITSKYVLIVIFASLLLFVENLIVWISVLIITISVLMVIVFLLGAFSSKTVYIICFILSITTIILSGRFLMSEWSAMKYDFGSAKLISTSKDIDFCMKHKIRNVSFDIEHIEDTGYYLEKSVEINGANTGHQIDYYYSVINLRDVKILLKHSEKSVPSKKKYCGIPFKVGFKGCSGIQCHI